MESSVVHMTGLEMFALTNYFPKIEAKTFITTNVIPVTKPSTLQVQKNL